MPTRRLLLELALIALIVIGLAFIAGLTVGLTREHPLIQQPPATWSPAVEAGPRVFQE